MDNRRKFMLRVLLSEQEKKKLERIMARTGESMSGAARRAILEMYEKIKNG